MSEDDEFGDLTPQDEAPSVEVVDEKPSCRTCGNELRPSERRSKKSGVRVTRVNRYSGLCRDCWNEWRNDMDKESKLQAQLHTQIMELCIVALKKYIGEVVD